MGLAYSLRFHHRVFKRFLSANIQLCSHCKPLHWGCIRYFPRSELIRKLVFEVRPYLPMAASRVMLMLGNCSESCCLRCMESSPIGDGELVPQYCWILRAYRDSCHTIRYLINHFDWNLAIELEPRLKDPFLPLLRPNVLQKVLAPVLKRCPTHRVQRHDVSYRRNDCLCGS
jgi:hypothetical protein